MFPGEDDKERKERTAFTRTQVRSLRGWERGNLNRVKEVMRESRVRWCRNYYWPAGVGAGEGVHRL